MSETTPPPSASDLAEFPRIPVVVLLHGPVDGALPHVELWAEKGHRLLARVAPADPGQPDAGTFVIQWEQGNEAQTWRKAAEQELDFYLVSKLEMLPWSYLCYHCGTGANGYAWDRGGVCFALRDPKG